MQVPPPIPADHKVVSVNDPLTYVDQDSLLLRFTYLKMIIAILLSMMFISPERALAQQSKMPVIGYLSSQSQKSVDLRLAPFKQGLKEAGFVEGHNIRIEYRW